MSRRWSGPLALGLALLAWTAAARAATFPTTANVYFKTSSREQLPSGGDWYTTRTSGSTDRIHRWLLEVTPAQLASCGGGCTITIQDAECRAGTGPPDDVVGSRDPSRFELRTADGVTVLQTQSLTGAEPNGTNVTLTVSTAGRYQITSVTGAFPISGNTAVGLNDDDNAFRIDVPLAGGATGGLFADLQTTFVHTVSPSITLSLYFLVPPAAGSTALQLRNFDMDGATSVTYTRPGGTTVAGTASGNAVWNSGGTLNSGADSVTANTTAGSGAPDAGRWAFTVVGFTNTNQTLFEVLSPARLPVLHQSPLRAGNFTMTPPTTLSTNLGTSVDHAFTVTNEFIVADLINLTTSATAANWTVQLLNGSGGALPDTDGNGQPDTGILLPGQSISLILRVTPNSGAIGPDQTSVQGVSFLDTLIVPGTNTTVTLTKTTWIRPQIAKAFAPSTVAVNVSSTLTFTLTNRNTTALTNLAFTDSYPAGLVNATPLVVGGTCTGVTTTAVAGGATFNVTSGNVPAGSPGSCTITVAVRSGAAGSYANTSSGASGTISGSAIAAGPASGSATLTVSAPLSGTKVFSPNPAGTGRPATLTVTLTNTLPTPLTGVTFTDTFPVTPGAMTVAAPLTPSNSCGGTLQDVGGAALAAGDGGIRLAGGALAAGASCAVSVAVTAPVAGSYTNTIPIGGISSTQGVSNLAAVSAMLTAEGPALAAVKSSVTLSDPYNGGSNPKAIPGAFVLYTIVVTNSGLGRIDADTVLVLDALAASTGLRVGDIGAPGSGPVSFVDGSPASGLTYSFVSLASAADDVSFSNDGGATFSYVPLPDAGGVDEAVTHIRIEPSGSMNGSGGGNPSFTVSFRVRID